jgi:glutathione S-transferase
MITLYTFGPFFDCPDASPFVMKAQMLLKLAGLPHETNTRGFTGAPKGKLPYIRDGDAVVADSTLIRLHIEQKYGFDFDAALSERERGIAWSVEKMLEDHLYWLLVYWRWMIDANFDRGPRNFFKRVPAVIRPLVVSMVRKRVRANLHAHGIGRHNVTEKNALGFRCIDSLAQVLGDNTFLMGPKPCGADATAFAFISALLPEIFESPLRDKLAATKNLVAYHRRMLAEFHPKAC